MTVMVTTPGLTSALRRSRHQRAGPKSAVRLGWVRILVGGSSEGSPAHQGGPGRDRRQLRPRPSGSGGRTDHAGRPELARQRRSPLRILQSDGDCLSNRRFSSTQNAERRPWRTRKDTHWSRQAESSA